MARIHRRTTLKKKGLSDLHFVVTNWKPDILECEVKWALGNTTTNKASGSDGIPIELFQVLKDDAVKVLHSVGQQIRKAQQWPQDWKRSFFIPIPKKAMPKNVQSTVQSRSGHMLEKQCSKSFQLSFSCTWTKNFQMYKLSLEKEEIKLPTFES